MKILFPLTKTCGQRPHAPIWSQQAINCLGNNWKKKYTCKHPLWTCYVTGLFYISCNILRIKIKCLIITSKTLCLPSVEFKHNTKLSKALFWNHIASKNCGFWQLVQIHLHLSYMQSNLTSLYQRQIPASQGPPLLNAWVLLCRGCWCHYLINIQFC